MEQFKAELEKRDFKELPNLVHDVEQFKTEIDKREIKNSIQQDIEEFKLQFKKNFERDLKGPAEIDKGDKDQEEGNEPKQQVKSWKGSTKSLAAAGCKDSV